MRQVVKLRAELPTGNSYPGFAYGTLQGELRGSGGLQVYWVQHLVTFVAVAAADEKRINIGIVRIQRHPAD
jgi:hypothetical protein